MAPGTREKDPAPHAVQAGAAAAPLQDPGLHGAHTLAEVAPVAAEYCPAPQGVHAAATGWSLHVPAPQRVQYAEELAATTTEK